MKNSPQNRIAESNDLMLKLKNFIGEIFVNENLSATFGGIDLHISEVVAPKGGLAKLIQQALLMDYFKQSNHVWDNGLFIEENEEALCGYSVKFERPVPGAAKYPLFAMIIDSIKVGAQLSPDKKTLVFDNMPVFAMPAYMEGTEDILVDWQDMVPFFNEKEAQYKSRNFMIGEEYDRPANQI